MWLMLLIVTITVAASTLFHFRARHEPDFKTAGLPMVWPIFGALFTVWRHFYRFHDLLVDICSICGDGESWSTGLFASPPVVVVGANPGVIEHVLQRSFHKYVKGERFRERMQEFVGNGIFNVDGQEWRNKRKVACHLFSAQYLKEEMILIFHRYIQQALGVLGRHAASNEVFDLQDVYFRFTLDTFGEVTFGEEIGCLSDPNLKPFAVAFDVVQRAIAARFFSPFWRVKRWLNIGSERELAIALSVLHNYGRGMVARAKLRHEQGLRRDTSDLLQRYIDYAEEKGNPVSDQEMTEIVTNFLPAGRDTTACLLTWATYEFSRDATLQQRLYDECKDVSFDADTLLSRPLPDLPLLRGLLLETLRLHPSVAVDTKECAQDDVWPTGQRVSAGTMVVYSSYIMGRSTKLWGADALQFKPDRWIDERGQAIKEPSAYKFPVFNAGMRLCVGKAAAMTAATMMLCMAIQQFEFYCESSVSDITYDMTISLPIKGGLKMRVKSRQLQ